MKGAGVVKRFLFRWLTGVAVLAGSGAAAGWPEPAGAWPGCPLLELAGFVPVPFTQTWVRGNDTVDLRNGRICRWSRLLPPGEAAALRQTLRARSGPPRADFRACFPNGETWQETVWIMDSGCQLRLLVRPRGLGAFCGIVLTVPAAGKPGMVLEPQPVMPGACRAAVIATLARCAGIDMSPPLAVAAWQGGEAAGVGRLFRKNRLIYRQHHAAARDRAVNRHTLQWLEDYNRQATDAGVPLLLIGDLGAGHFAWEETAVQADPVIAAAIPVPDEDGCQRFRRDIQTSLSAGFPVGWTLRRRTHGPRHRRLIVGYDEASDRIVFLDAMPPFVPRFMPVNGAWVQTLSWQTVSVQP